MTTQSGPISSRRSILRLLAVAVVSFLSGHQLRNARVLFRMKGMNYASEPIDGLWDPSHIYRSDAVIEGVVLGQNKFSTINDTQEEKIPFTNEEETSVKKRKKAPTHFNSFNYTSDFRPLPWTLPNPTPLQNLTSEEFMMKYIATKREYNIALPWEENVKYADRNVSLPLPIIALNFPKSATLTMKTFFTCGGLTSIHTTTQNGRIGICMMENQMNDNPPLDGCNTHRPSNQDAMRPIDFISDIGLQGPPCYYASLHDGGLENIAKYYPDATILLVTRNARAWARSMAKWGSILNRWKLTCAFDGRLNPRSYWRRIFESLPPDNKNEEYWVRFYLAHTQKIREFALEHPYMTYVEVELENDNAGEILEQYTKVSQECLLDCHPGPKWIKQHNATSRCHPIGQNPAHHAIDEEKVIREDGSENIIHEDDGALV